MSIVRTRDEWIYSRRFCVTTRSFLSHASVDKSYNRRDNGRRETIELVVVDRIPLSAETLGEPLEKHSAIASSHREERRRYPRTFDFTFVHADRPGRRVREGEGVTGGMFSPCLRCRLFPSTTRNSTTSRGCLVVIIDPFLRKGLANPSLSLSLSLSNEFSFTLDREQLASRRGDRVAPS